MERPVPEVLANKFQDGASAVVRRFVVESSVSIGPKTDTGIDPNKEFSASNQPTLEKIKNANPTGFVV